MGDTDVEGTGEPGAAVAGPRTGGASTTPPPQRPITAADQEDTRLQLRAMAQKSTYFMAFGVLGFKDMTKRTHMPMADFIQGPSRRKLVLAPRGTFKSSIVTVADIVRLIACDPNIRILLVSASQTNASHFLRSIQEVFEKNTVFQWLFPEVIPDFRTVKKWSETEMLVPRSRSFPESTVEAIGVGGTVVSRHFDHIKNDDLVDEKIAESETEMDRVIRWVNAEESLLVSTQTGKIDTVGTRWAWRDVYGHMLEHEPNLDTYVQAARDEDGPKTADNLFFPERLSHEELDRLKAKQGVWLYSCLYLNRPSDPEAMTFRREWLRWYRLDGDQVCPSLGPPIKINDLSICLRVDPAISEDSKAARTAVVVDGVSADGRKFLLETWAKRCQPAELFNVIFDLCDKWGTQRVGVESVAYQKTLKYFLAEESIRRNRWVDIVELKPDTKKSKPARIRAVQPFLQRGEIWVRQDQTEFLQEYDWFGGGGKTVDILDAWAYGPMMWQAPLEPEAGDELADDWAFESQMDGRSILTGY